MSALPENPQESAAPALEGRIARTVRRTEEIVFTVLLLGMIVIGIAPIILRRFLPMGLTWSEPLGRHMVLWIALFGAAAATQERNYIAIDAVAHFLRPKRRLLIRGITEFLSAVVCAVLVWVGSDFVRDLAEYEGEAIAFLGVREWWLAAVVPAGFAWLTLRLLAAAWQDLRDSRRHAGSAEAT